VVRVRVRGGLIRLAGTQVAPPRVGETHPASVQAEVVVDTRGMRGDVACGWDELKQHDVLFLLAGACACARVCVCVFECGHVAVCACSFAPTTAADGVRAYTH
jgi:hypothetical protein